MKYAGIIYDDTAAAPGLSLSLFTQGCPHKCKECHNPETWDYEGGHEFTDDTILNILDRLNFNGVLRNLCIMGGEPLISRNLDDLAALILNAKMRYKDLKVYLWTGYTMEELVTWAKMPEQTLLKILLSHIDVLIDGRYDYTKRDVTLPLRGSTNQNVYHLVTGQQLHDVAKGRVSKIEPLIEDEILFKNDIFAIGDIHIM